MSLVVDIPSAPAAAATCAHCGLAVPAGLMEPAAERQFCCPGCRTVWSMIHACGMDKYYAVLDASEGRQRAQTTGRAYQEYEDAVFLEGQSTAMAGGLRESELYLQGVHCAACVWLVEKLPRILPGVLEARLDMGKALVRIVWDPQRVGLSRVARVLDSLGYSPHPARGVSRREVRRAEDRLHLIRMGVAGACAGNTMLLAAALYAGVFASMEASYTLLFRWLSMAIGMLALLWPGRVFFKGAWAAIRTRTAHLDLPIALGLAAGGIAGVVNTLLNRGDIYFDSLTVLVFLLLVGRWLQKRQQGSADDAVELLFSLTPSAARRLERDGKVCEVPIAALAPGDTVEVRAGESVPVDGEVVAGVSNVDEALLTGESHPVEVEPGGNVCAGTVNRLSTLQIRVTAAGEATRVGKLMKLVAQCARARAPIVLLADRIAGYFLAAVLLLALGTLAFWMSRGDAGAADHAVALLIVACPCALGLATPLAVAVALGRAARRQILIKGGAVLEHLAGARRGTLFLDKTGTLTTGATTLVHWHGPEALQPLVAAVEAQATHPIARALCAAFPAGLERRAEAVIQHRCGISGVVAGRSLLIGSATFMSQQRVPVDSALQQIADGYIAEGCTPVFIAQDARLLAVAALGDALRPDARAALDALRCAGWSIGILSGDHPEVVRRVAAQLAIPEESARGGLLPEEKLACVQACKADGPVVMVGDGVNDAAALSAATVGIAVHGGAEASLAAADIYLGRPGLSPIVELLSAARNTVRVIRWSMAFSLFYNLLAVSLAVTGYIHPLLAALLMPISSLTVLSLAFAARTFPR